jgi:D-beta-D-heptose 7-phosphate kinase / D-beta-D-heptose 1-phosphate adenosyltransferase
MALSRSEVLERMEGVSVLVLGDVMLDEYLFGDIQRISPEAPVPVVALGRQQFHLGGAGNVASNVAALGGRPILIGVVGTDTEGQRLEDILSKQKVEHRLVRQPNRPTTRKTRVLARNQHVVRLDQEVSTPLDEAAREAVLDAVKSTKPQLLIVSDYGKGVISRPLMRDVVAWARSQGVLVLVDPKSTDFTLYAGADYVTPNAREASLAAGKPSQTPEECIECGRTLLGNTGGKGILLTRSEKGMGLIDPREAHFVSAQARTVYDVTGAGDTVIATFGMALAAGAEPVEAMALSNFAAGVVVQRVGAAACTREELAREAGISFPMGGPSSNDQRLRTPRLMSLPEAAATAERWRSEGKRVVFTNGCFDILHAGHVVLLEEARSRGDALIIGLNTDDSIRRLKGPTLPAQPLQDRARVLAALHAVDAVVPFDEDTPLNLVLALKPDVLVKGGDYQVSTIVGAKEVMGWGGEVAVISLLPDRSTTALLQRKG